MVNVLEYLSFDNMCVYFILTGIVKQSKLDKSLCGWSQIKVFALKSIVSGLSVVGIIKFYKRQNLPWSETWESYYDSNPGWCVILAGMIGN